MKRKLAIRSRAIDQIPLLQPRDCPDPLAGLQLCFFQLALGVNEFLAEAKNSGFVIYKLLVYGMTGTNSNDVGSLAKNKHSIL